MPSRQPQILALGRTLGARSAREYADGAADAVAEVEKRMSTVRRRLAAPPAGSGRTSRARTSGRSDIVLFGEDHESQKPFVVIVEVKNTDWDGRRDVNVRPLALRHARQLWRYLDALDDLVAAGDVAWLQGAVLYRRTPGARRRRDVIEAALEERAISTVWEEELPPAARTGET